MRAGGCSVVVLASGAGSNLQRLIDAAASPASGHWQLRAVLGDRPAAQALERARLAGIPTVGLDPAAHPSRGDFDAALQAAIDHHAPDLLVMAGFMRILSPAFIDHYAGRMLNIHPSLLPAYRGLHTHRRALAERQTLHGCSVHVVTEALDAGPVIAQIAVAVQPDDTESTLAARVLTQEHRLLPHVVGWYASGRLRIDGARPTLDGRPLEAPLRILAEQPLPA
jgi:phosphoribosylglycinamide formyltransferase 1